MTNIRYTRLQTILKPNKEICNESGLYFHEEDGLLKIDGFFNLFYIEKHKYYTTLKELRLSLKLKGWSSFVLMHNQDEIMYMQLESDLLRDYTIALPYEDYDEGVFWFSLAGDYSEKSVFEGCYEGASESELLPVDIAVDICTYRREPYVLRNMRSLCSGIYDNPAIEVREHLEVMLIDNGQTLHTNAEFVEFMACEPHIHLYQNINSGGAGGFTRGMLEVIRHNEAAAANADDNKVNNEASCEHDISIKESDNKASSAAAEAMCSRVDNEAFSRKFTHVLLMDDDAVFDPDLFVRLYGFLSMLKTEYKDISVGGALMREEIPCYQFSSGEQYRHNKAFNPYPMKDMRVYDNCVAPYMCSTHQPPNSYSGWWCCCFSMNVVTKNNLPLPIFIHCDDVEYGLRNQAYGLAFLNGICVWHRCLEYAYPGSNLYYDIRNKIILNALHNPRFNKLEALYITIRAMTATLIMHRYAETEFVYRGLVDFCRGSSWLMKINPAELNNELRSKMHWQSYDELAGELSKTEWAKVSAVLESMSDKSRIQAELRDMYGGTKAEQASRGCTADDINSSDKPYRGIPIIRACDSPFRALLHRRVILCDPTSRKAMLAKRNLKEELRLIKLFPKACIIAMRSYDKAAADYRKHRDMLTSDSTL